MNATMPTVIEDEQCFWRVILNKLQRAFGQRCRGLVVWYSIVFDLIPVTVGEYTT